MNPLPVRVMVEDSWDQVDLELPPTTPVAEVKQRALELTHTARNPGDYLVKFRGAQILDEARSLSESGVVPHSSLIVMSRRRRAVR